tara:strand:- start:7970 stop:8365 length:396 start_codon:yes stop_codon:yes gene_type:complete
MKTHGCDKMNDLIKQKVLSRNWTFNEISNLKETIGSLSQEIYLELSLPERYDIIRGIRVNEGWVGLVFEDVMREAIMTTLQGDVAGIIRSMLNTATVNFGGNVNEISENGMGGESNKKRSTNAKKKDDDKE